MARALIVGCGCRGLALGVALAESGWIVRGTSRDEGSLERIEAAGVEAVLGDPGRIGTLVEHLQGVTVVVWLMGSATDEARAAEVNGPRLERMLEKLVDSPVRGFAYEAAGTVDPEVLAAGAQLVEEAAARWRIPSRVIELAPEPIDPWLMAFKAAADALVSG